jgi:hypothetical protein
LKKVDISPFEGKSFPKLLIYIVWGLNASIFLGEEIIADHFAFTDTKTSVSPSVSCTILNKVDTDADLNDKIELVNTREFVISSSCDNELVSFDVIINQKSRAPPAGSALT